MQYLCSYRVKKVYTQNFWGGENSKKHGRVGTIVVCCMAVVVIHPMTHEHALMQDCILPSGGFISCNSPVRRFIFCE
jgi:hypothetical protein